MKPLPPPRTWGRGWGHYQLQCGRCGGEWIGVAPVGTKGIACPFCNQVRADALPGDEKELPNDGAWIGNLWIVE